MTDSKRVVIRVLIVDDEAEVRDAYRQILVEADMNGETAVLRSLRDRLFVKPAAEQALKKLSARNTVFAPHFCDGAEAAVAAVRDAIADGRSVRGGVSRHADAAGAGRRLGCRAHSRNGSGH